jgi:hypothetical protein
MKKGDIILLILTVLIASGIFVYFNLSSDKGSTFLQIIIDQEVVNEVELNSNTNLTIPIENQYGYNLIIVKDGIVSVDEADCSDLVCVHSKQISHNGESIVCLPHKLIVRVVSDTESQIDSVSQ